MSPRLPHRRRVGLVRTVLAVTLAGASGCGEDQRRSVTEEAARELLHSVDKAVERQNPTELGAYIADGAPVNLHVDDGANGGLDGDKVQYLRALEEGFRRAREYRYERRDTRIAIEENSPTARATYTVQEVLRYDDSTARAVTRYEVTLAYRDGALKITAIEGRTTAE